MNRDNLINIKIEAIKRKLISNYIILIISILGIYSLVFYFLAKNIQLAGFLFCGFCFVLYTWLIVRKNYSIGRTVHFYLITAPLFNLVIMIIFWKDSVASYMWLFAIPIAAYIFFSTKTTFYYTIYVTINILAAYIINENFSIDYPTFQNRNQLVFSDTLLFVFNLLTLLLLLYYKDKINKIETMSYLTNENMGHTNEIEHIEEPPSEEELSRYNVLFKKIEKTIKEEGYFKQSDFNMSKLSTLLNTNNVYISKAIKLNGYPNFITYLNSCRVNNFKQLISENDLRKVTLMYLYSSSGFSNQSTFNRVFKQIEGITPSEYITQIEKLSKEK